MMHPERVTSLVLVNAAGFGPELAWWLRLRSLINMRPNGKPAPWPVRIGLKRIFEDPTRIPADLIERLIEVDLDREGQSAARRVLSIGVDWRGIKPLLLKEIRDAADQIRVPTLIVWGKQDRVVPVKHAAVAHARIPQARLHLFDNCGHTPQLEFPDKFNSLVRDFVRETNGH
jgi:4,5:9,10-diseco-3-hydroxy-5,9,17-trioxoandrosta-1(10),2-diene-4-oate hydrolase